MSKFTKKQKLFIEAATHYVHSGEINPDSVDKNQLQKIADVAEVGFPYWITRKNAGYKVGRGLFRIPVNGYGYGMETTETMTSEPKTTEVVEPVDDSTLSLAKGTVEKVSNIPEKDSLFVPQGHFKSVESVIKSKQFYPVFVTGLSGNGKTFMVEQACAKLKRDMYRVNITIETDEDDLLGGFRLVNGETVWFDGPVVEAMKSGGVLLLDEVDLASTKIMCLQPVLEGKGIFLKKINEWVKPVDGFNVIATANTKGKGDDTGNFIGAGVLNEAFLERFPICLEADYPTESTEVKILDKVFDSAGHTGSDVKDFARKLVRWAQVIRTTYKEGAIDDLISTRRLVHIANAWGIFGQDKMKAVELCIARFDEDTKSAMVDLYTKVDADALAKEEEETSNRPEDLEQPF